MKGRMRRFKGKANWSDELRRFVQRRLTQLEAGEGLEVVAVRV